MGWVDSSFLFSLEDAISLSVQSPGTDYSHFGTLARTTRQVELDVGGRKAKALQHQRQNRSRKVVVRCVDGRWQMAHFSSTTHFALTPYLRCIAFGATAMPSYFLIHC